MTTTTTTDNKETKQRRKKEPLKTGFQVLRDYRQKYPENSDIVTEVKEAIKEQESMYSPEFRPLCAPIFTGMRSLVLGSFHWSETKQGFEYWEKVFNRMDD